MNKQVFICHSNKDKQMADKICHLLENKGFSCWIAPRDVPAGAKYDESILDGLDNADAVVLLLSQNANNSPHVKREVELASNQSIPLFPVRIEDVQPGKNLKYFLAGMQWVDIWKPQIEQKVARLAVSIKAQTGYKKSDITMDAVEAKPPEPGNIPLARILFMSIGVVMVILLIFWIVNRPSIPPVIPLSFTYKIENSMNVRPGKLDDVCYSGDRIYLAFETGVPCWITLFCIDPTGIIPVFRGNLSPGLIKENTNYTLDFTLDTTQGKEYYYLIAAHDTFDFEKDILPKIKKKFPEGNSKGPLFSEYRIELPKEFFQRVVYFKHLNR